MNQIPNLNKQIKELGTLLKEKKLRIVYLETWIDGLDIVLQDKKVDNVLEEYWNNKRQKSSKKYLARPAFNGTDRINVDPRIFYTNNHDIPKVPDGTFDEMAMACRNYVEETITYTTDTQQFKQTEIWMFPFETLKLKKGDCEDGAILMVNMMLKAGIPYWRIRLNAGDVNGGGHAYVTYLKEEDTKWYVLDWCYWPEASKNWLPWSEASNYFGIWFSWNTKYVFTDSRLDR